MNMNEIYKRYIRKEITPGDYYLLKLLNRDMKLTEDEAKEKEDKFFERYNCKNYREKLLFEISYFYNYIKVYIDGDETDIDKKNFLTLNKLWQEVKAINPKDFNENTIKKIIYALTKVTSSYGMLTEFYTTNKAFGESILEKYGLDDTSSKTENPNTRINS